MEGGDEFKIEVRAFGEGQSNPWGVDRWCRVQNSLYHHRQQLH